MYNVINIIYFSEWVFPIPKLANDLSKISVYSRQIRSIEKILKDSIYKIINENIKLSNSSKTSTLTKCITLSSCYIFLFLMC